MTNILVIAVVGLILGLAIGYIVKQRKKGVDCIGCPNGGNCSGNCPGCDCK